MRQGAMIDRGALYELGNRYRNVDIGKKKQPHPLNRAQKRYGVMINLNWVATEKGIMRLSVFLDKWIKWKNRKSYEDFLEDMPDLYSPRPRVVPPPPPRKPRAAKPTAVTPTPMPTSDEWVAQPIQTSRIIPPVPLVKTLKDHEVGQHRWEALGPTGECFQVWYKWFPQEKAWGLMANTRFETSAKYIQRLVNNGQIESDMDNDQDATIAIVRMEKWFNGRLHFI